MSRSSTTAEGVALGEGGWIASERGRRAILLVAGALFLLTAARAVKNDHGTSNLDLDQARAFLHGTLAIEEELPDGVTVNGRQFDPFPPLPSLLLVPLLALGPWAAKPTLVALLAAAGSLLLFRRILARLDVGREATEWLLLAFFLGSAFWPALAASAGIWNYAHVVAVFFLLLALDEALGRGRGWIAGLSLGGAVLSRQLTIWCALFIVAALRAPRPDGDRSRRQRAVAAFLAALSIAVAAYLLFNRARFGSAFDTGYGHIRLEAYPFLDARVRRFGLFHPAYLLFNAVYLFFAGPHFLFDASSLLPVGMDPFGTSLLFASPFVLFAFRASWERALKGAAWGSIGLALVHQLLYYNNGWVQTNAQRFTLDFLPLLMILVALSVRERVSPLFRAAVLYAVALDAVALVVLPILAFLASRLVGAGP